MAKKDLRNGKWSPLTIILLVVLCVYVLSLCGLFFWAFITSFKGHSRMEFAINNYYKFPQFGWKEQFSEVFKNLTMPSKNGTGQVFGFWTILSNTFLYAIGCAFFKTLVPCVTAYACARFNFKSSRIIHTIILVTMIVPIVGSLPSEIAMARAVGIYDKIWGMWLMRANFRGMYFLVLHEMFKAIPASYSEAATIDGASDFQILWKIGFPLARNTFMTCFLLNFVTLWNDYQISTVYLPTHPTLAEGIHWMQQGAQIGSTSPIALSGVFVLMLPVLVLFLCFHKRLMGNLTIGGVKG